MSLSPQYLNEINALNRELLKAKPDDVLQFCANFFNRRLESQRAEFLLAGSGGGSNKMAESNFPGVSAFGGFGSPSGGGGGGGGIGTLAEEDEENEPMSPSMKQDAGAAKAAPASGSPFGGDSSQEGGFGSFGGFGSSFGGPPSASKSGDSGSLPAGYGGNRRVSVSAESMVPTSSGDDNWKPPVHEKTADQNSRLRSAVSGNFLFAHLDEDQLLTVLGALSEKLIPAKGIKVISQGDAGDYFYVVEEGEFDVYVHPSGQLQAGADGMGNKVAQVVSGGSFGELALMYNAPRAATVVSTGKSVLWQLDRVTFRRILMDSTFQRRRLYEKFLEEVELLKELHPYERSKIADALDTKEFPAGSTIIREGDPGDAFYLLESGECEAYKRGTDAPVKQYSKGDYFGELALLNDAPRAASVVSKGKVKVATLGKDGFSRLLGPVEDIMRRQDYSKAEDAEVDPLSG